MTQNISQQSTVVLLPETRGNLVCLEYHGIVKRNDYHCAVEKIKNVTGSGKKMRLLVVFAPDFQGWEEDAAELNLKSIIEHAPMTLKAAYVNPPKRKILQMKLMEPAVPGDVRNFESDEIEKALTWLKED